MQDPKRRKRGPVDSGQSDLETRMWLRMLACSNLITSELRAGLRDDFGTTLARFDVLAQIARPPAAPTMSELSQRLMVTKGNITDAITRLETDKLVVRRGDPADARIQRVSLTPKGRKLLDAMLPAHKAWLSRLLREVDREDLQQLEALLLRLRTALRAARQG